MSIEWLDPERDCYSCFFCEKKAAYRIFDGKEERYLCEECLNSFGDNVEELRRTYKALSDAKEALAVVHDEGLIGWDVYDRGTKALAKAMAQLDLKFLTYDEMKVRELTVDDPECICDGCNTRADFEVISDGVYHYFCSDCLNEKMNNKDFIL